jgi:preprotein translocase subunit SecD
MGRSKASPWVFLVFIFVLGFGAFFVDSAWTPLWPSNHGINVGGYVNQLKIKEGLDLQGGIQFVLQASCPTNNKKCNSAFISDNLGAVVQNLNTRVNNGLGVNDVVIQTQGGNRISVQIPGLQDAAQAEALLGKTGQMFIFGTTQAIPQGTQVTAGSDGQYSIPGLTGSFPVLFTGGELDTSSINAGLDSTSNQPIVTFTFTGKARTDFANYTRDHIGQFLTTTLDNSVINSASINSEIDGNGEIQGLGSVTEAQNLATYLKYGSLPLPLSVISEDHLAATLGSQAIAFSIRAALVGLGLVMLFMLFYYRLPGLLADLALLLYALFIFAVIKLLGVDLSLAGIAGLVLSVGMAVDANVLIFERIKEELRSGRTMAAAIDIGFKRAWPSIRDSNASTMITCVILYLFGNNFGATIIVGFATNLFLGVAISLFTAVVVTRNFLNVLIPTGIATHPALYGLPASALNVPRYNPTRARGGTAALATAGLRTRGAGGGNGTAEREAVAASNGSRPPVGAARGTGGTSGRNEAED